MKMILLKSCLVLSLVGVVSGCKSLESSESSSKMLSEGKQTFEPELRSIVMSHRDVMLRYMSRITERIPAGSVDNQLKQNLKKLELSYSQLTDTLFDNYLYCSNYQDAYKHATAANESFKDAGSNTAGFSSLELANIKRHLESLRYVFTTCKLELTVEEGKITDRTKSKWKRLRTEMKDRIYVMDVEYGLLKNKDDRIKIFDLPFSLKRMEKHLTEAIDSIWYYEAEKSMKDGCIISKNVTRRISWWGQSFRDKFSSDIRLYKSLQSKYNEYFDCK